MDIKVRLSNFRAAPRKARLVADLVRGKSSTEAASILTFTVNKTAKPMLKLLNSAVATAKNDFKLNEANLYVSKVTVDEGPKMKRWHPMSRGRAYQILKRTSHIILTLSELVPTEKTEKSKPRVSDSKIQAKPVKPKSKKPVSKPRKKSVSKIKK